MTTAPPAIDRAYFRTAPTLPDEASGWKGVDRNRKIVFGARLIQLGELNDYDSRPWTVDAITLEQALFHGTKRSKGLKARFSHPNMSDDGLGTFLGYWKNLKIVDDSLIGDLYLSDSAFDTPKGDLGSYVLDRAEEDPDSFGVSLATKLDESELFDEETGRPIEAAGIRFLDVRAADVVDSPAATRGGLFDAVDFSDVRDLTPYLDWAIDRHFSQLSPVAILDKCRRYLSRKFGVSLPMSEDTKTTDNHTPAEDTKPDNFAPATGSAPDATPTTPDTPAPDPPQSVGQFSKEEVERFREAFGHELGATLLCDGHSFESASKFHREMQATQIADLEAENKDLREQLSALMGDRPVETGEPRDKPPEKVGAFRRAIRKSSSN